MNNKITFVEINYHCHQDLADPKQVIEKHRPSNLFADEFTKYADGTLVKHANYEGELTIGNIHYRFFKRSNIFLQIPSRTHRFIKGLKPDLVLVQGFIFPVQLIMLRRTLGKKTVIVLQHHKESPLGKKVFIQALADKYVNGYIFSALGSSDEWIKRRVIKTQNKCYEMSSASTEFRKLDKEYCRQLTGMKNEINFLWIGRLNTTKDPLTVLKAFAEYFSSGAKGVLWMIYNEEDLLPQVNEFLKNTPILQQRVKLVGALPNNSLINWYSAADYYISTSGNEGGSYALIEAMACGCVPIVTNIPSAMKAIDNGNCGYYFAPGDVEGLTRLLKELKEENRELMALKSIEQFRLNMSPAAIADQLYNIYLDLKPK